MLKLLIFLVFVISCSVFLTQAFSLEVELQKEDERIQDALGFLKPGEDDFQEQFQIIVDESNLKNRISIGLLSTNSDDIIFPDYIEDLAYNPRIFSYTITNQFACSPNSIDKACVIIAVKREGLGTTLEEIRTTSFSCKSVSDSSNNTNKSSCGGFIILVFTGINSIIN